MKLYLGLLLIFLSSQVGHGILRNSTQFLIAAKRTCFIRPTPNLCHPNEPTDLVFNSNPLSNVTESWKINMTAKGKVENETYGAEDHFVQTKDGYEIYLLRVIGHSVNPTPCLLVHGTFQSANDWVVQPNKTSLAMQLADNSCDVWIMSLRGTTNSTNFRPPVTQANYWNFSLDNQIAIDAPAVIDYILDHTNQSKLIYVGYSLGGTLGMGLMASKPEYNDKILSFIGIHAPAYHGNTTSRIWRLGGCLATKFPQVRNLQQSGIPTAFLPAIWTVLTEQTWTLCQEGHEFGACSELLNAIFGMDNHPTNETAQAMLPVVARYFPNSESMQTFVQTLWDIVDPVFSYFDFGRIGNLAAYNQTIPPRYNVSKITTKVILYCSKCDSTVDIKDCDRLVANLPTPPTYFKIQNFNHIDAFYGAYVEEFYNHIVGQVNQVLGLLG